MVAILIKKLTYFRPLFSVLEEEKDIKDLIAGHKDDFGTYKLKLMDNVTSKFDGNSRKNLAKTASLSAKVVVLYY